MSRALHVRPLTRNEHFAPKKSAKVKQRPKPKLELVPKDAPRTLIERSVEVFDRDGHLIEIYSVVLEGGNCHDVEFEEVALIFAEQSGRITVEEFIHLRARCA